MILYRILLIFVLLFSNIDITEMNDNNILEIMTTANEVTIYQNNTSKDIDIDSLEFKKIRNELNALSKTSRESPAFGVALHNETIEALKNGIWIEFKFEKTISHNELPFDSLLINIVSDYTGFNIIRNYNNKYDGRCFYVDLIETNLSNLQDIILETF